MKKKLVLDRQTLRVLPKPNLTPSNGDGQRNGAPADPAMGSWTCCTTTPKCLVPN